ncbi:MAG: O-antigen ligase family protein [Alphaproteobacteria bacterium]|nr:O-antigen ligase family protein [Alphaproteobacteria bacterium]
MSRQLGLAIIPLYVALCLIIGGASAAGYWANMGLQLVALPIIFAALVVDRRTPMARPARQLCLLLVLLLLVVGAQLVPLPPALWTALPGRRSVVQGFVLLGEPLPWMPISLDPSRTVSSFLWLLPAFAVFLGIVRLGAFRPSWLAWVLAAVTTLSIAIGGLQIAGGEQSPWYFYDITNRGVTVGFFSNANHLATLLVATIPFLAALYLAAVARGRSVQKSSGLFVVLGGTLAAVIVGLVITASIAGIALSVPALAASLLMILSRRRRLPLWTPLLVTLLLAGSVAAAFSAPFNNNLTGAKARSQEDSRYNSFSKTIPAALEFLPTGSGIGTFQKIYRMREDPAHVDSFYMNHAHGDYFEVALETGVPGILLVLAFFLWWGRRTLAIWRSDDPDYFARAATIASAAILTHSIVDYPLRTAAIGAVFALCCGLMAGSRPRTREGQVERAAGGRHLIAD